MAGINPNHCFDIELDYELSIAINKTSFSPSRRNFSGMVE